VLGIHETWPFIVSGLLFNATPGRLIGRTLGEVRTMRGIFMDFGLLHNAPSI